MIRTHYIITATNREGFSVRIEHHGNQDKRFLIGLYGLNASCIQSYSIRVAGTHLVYSRINAPVL